jgi:hypothetical protein
MSDHPVIKKKKIEQLYKNKVKFDIKIEDLT